MNSKFPEYAYSGEATTKIQAEVTGSETTKSKKHQTKDMGNNDKDLARVWVKQQANMWKEIRNRCAL